MILHATETGHGPPMVLLHGLFGRSQNLATLGRRLANDFRVVALDLRNHGASPHAPGMAYQDMAEDVFETLAACDALPAGILGHSMGGKVAMVLALTHPKALSCLVVADIAPVAYRHANLALTRVLQDLPLTPGLTRSQADQALTGAIPDAAVRHFLLQNFVPGPLPGWRVGLADIAAGIPDIEGFPPLADTSRFDGPTLFLRGALSPYVKDAAIPVISARFPAARLETISEAGHWLHADQPEAFAAAVQEFLRDCGKTLGI